MIWPAAFLPLLFTSTLAASDPAKVTPIETRLSQDGKYFYYATRQDIKAPVWNIDLLDESSLAPGYWFVAPYEEKTQTVAGDAWVGPHIYDGNGDLIWSGTPQFGHWNVFDFDVTTIDGAPHLSGLDWQNQRGVVLDNSYDLLMTTPSVADIDTFQNMHGFTVVDNGRHGIVQTVRHWDVPAEVTYESIGYNSTCDANYEGFREMDLHSLSGTRVVLDWDGRKIGLNESTYIKYDGQAKTMCDRGWDLLHLNAVVKCPDGDYLLSARHTDAVYKISHTTGDIVWRLGGKMSDFELPNDGRFTRQHDARCLKQEGNKTVVSLFDNAVGEHWQAPSRRKSRGLILELDMETMKAEIVSQYEHPSGSFTDGRGSFQVLPNDNAFVNWATASHISEHTSDGRVIMQAKLSSMRDTYRAFKHPWVGRPNTPPDVHSEIVWGNDHKVSTNISMSWNGATEVAMWNIRGLDSNGTEIEIASSYPRHGFETGVQYDGYATNVYVQALDQDGNMLGSSKLLNTDKTSAHQHPPNVISASPIPTSPMPSSPKIDDKKSTSVSLAIGVVGGILGVLLSLAGFTAFRYVMRRRSITGPGEKGTYAAVVQDEENWELTEERSDSRSESPMPNPHPR